MLAELKAGNERFVANRGSDFDWLAQAEATSTGQYPKAIVLSCLDSRVIPEVVFDQGIGDIFVGRVAGNFENVDQLGSMEFGTKVAGAKFIVVLGHTSCGAVKGAIDQAKLGNLTAMLENIEPAIAAVPAGSQGRTSKDTGYVNRVVEANERQTVKDIPGRSKVIADLVGSGDLRVVGGVYDLKTGASAGWTELRKAERLSLIAAASRASPSCTTAPSRPFPRKVRSVSTAISPRYRPGPRRESMSMRAISAWEGSP